MRQTGVDPLGFVVPGTTGDTEELPGTEDVLGRFTGIWTPTQRLTAELKASIAHNEDNGVVSKTQLVKCFGSDGVPQRVFGVPSPNEDCDQDFEHSKTNIPAGIQAPEPSEFGGGETFTEYDSYRGSLRLDYELDSVALTSVTAFRHYDVDLLENFTFAGDGQVPGYEKTDWDNFSQELRVQTQFDGPVNFLGGVLYTDTKLFFRNSSRVAPLQRDPVTSRFYSYDKNAEEDGQSISGYGEVTWHIAPTLELAAGARYTDEEKDFIFRVPYVHSGLLAAGIFSNQSFDGKFEDDNVSPQATLTWRPNERLTVFGAYREGFKSGGFDASHLLGPAATIDTLRFESEEAQGFEVGVKSRWLDGTLRANATAYSFTYKNLQVQQYNAETTQFNIDNAAEATTDGVETQLTWTPLAGLTLRSTVNYNLAEYDEFLASCYAGESVEAGCNQAPNAATGRFSSQKLDGEQLSVAPEWSATGGFTYEVAVGDSGWRASLSTDTRYSGEYNTSGALIPEATDGDHIVVDTSLRAFSPDQRWEIALIGRNIANEAVAVLGGDRPLTGGGQGSPEGSPALQRADLYQRVQRGRQIWLQASYNLSY